MMEPDCDFPVTLMGAQTDVGILAGVGHWLFDLKRKYTYGNGKKRNIEMNMSKLQK